MPQVSMSKNKLVKIWLDKSRNDLLTAIKIAKPPEAYYDTAIYHCQQSAEKCIKGFLVFSDTVLEKTHDLNLLLELATDINENFSILRNSISILNPYSTLYRYPGKTLNPNKHEYKVAENEAKTIYNFIILKLRDNMPLQPTLFD